MPLNRPDVTFDDTKAFAKAVAEVLAAEAARTSSSRARRRTLREGRVLVDWYQNDRAKTTIGVYSLRARDAADRLDAGRLGRGRGRRGGRRDGGPLVFTAARGPAARVDAVGDLFAEVLEHRAAPARAG